MTTFVRTLRFAFYSGSENKILKQFAMLCGAGLLAFLLAMTYGLDLSPGFF